MKPLHCVQTNDKYWIELLVSAIIKNQLTAERYDHLNECPGYDAKQSDGEVPVMLGLWGMQSTPSLPLLSGPLWPGMVAPDRALSMG